MSYDGPVFDADEHYYEPIDAFTRHLPERWKERAVQIAEVGNRTRVLIGGKVATTIANPTFDPIVKPGALMDYFRGNHEGKELVDYLQIREPIPAYYRDRDARIRKLDEQNVESTWLLPSLGMSVEEDLRDDPEACGVAFRAFNRWMHEDWGFAYQDRIFTAPYLAFGDLDAAVAEVEFGLANGARLFVVLPTGVLTPTGWKSPGDSYFDPIWARIQEAGAVVVPHVGNVGSHGLERFVQHKSNAIAEAPPPLQIVFGHSRPIANYLAALVCDRLFERFPSLHVASIENGADCLPNLLPGIRRAGTQRPGYFATDPVEQFVAHIWVSPFWEDDIDQAISLIGAERVLFGSDWPHAEGVAAPRDYLAYVAHLDPAVQRKIMHDNAAAITGVAAVPA